jgi:DNA-binding response OmpR family regulator
MSKRILIVDDDALMRKSLAITLGQQGYTTMIAESAEAAIMVVRNTQPDLILLDIGLPGMDGLEALRAIRQQLASVPVIFVTARRRELDEIVGLELGADDYITKPFDLDVLMAHIKAVLRRQAIQTPIYNDQTLTVGDLQIDPNTHTVHIDARPVELSPKEFDLLLALARNPGHVFSMDELLNQVWGSEWIGETQTLYVHVRWLREKIEADPTHPKRLLTVRGAGYKLTPAG